MAITLNDVREARRRIQGALRPTPLLEHPLLSEELGCNLRVKHENHNPTGAFKVRGGLNLLSHIAEQGGCEGVITASTGNHGQSIAFASRRASIPCTVIVPEGNNPEKNAAMRAMGANVIEHGRDFDDARLEVERLCHGRGLRYIHSANEPHLISGVATYALESFEEFPDPDYIFVPIGGGSGACGCAIVRTALGRRARVIGVQSERADAFARSWHGPERVTGERADTFAEGLATRVTFDLTFDILKRELHDVITLSEEELGEGVRLAVRTTHNLAEGAGAAAIMAAKKMRGQLRGKKVLCVMSGGNLDSRVLARLLAT